MTISHMTNGHEGISFVLGGGGHHAKRKECVSKQSYLLGRYGFICPGSQKVDRYGAE